MEKTTPVIRRLPQQTINLIAAGEVVERPASILKELVENALDAKATSIDVHVENGGIEKLAVVDNGHGLLPDDISIAVERHATSKLDDDNLFNIQSFGFRGEALASLVAVADVQIVSRVAESDKTWQALYVYGDIKEEGPTKHIFDNGTKVTISRLFHNIPARRSFLRSVSSETQAIVQIFKSLAIAKPHVSFRLTVDGKDRFQLKGYPNEVEDALEARIGDVLGDTFFQNSITASFQHPSFPLTLSGRISLPTFHHATPNSAMFFINHRFVKDRALSYLLRTAYGDTVPKGRYPACALFLDIDPLLVDVNAHPAKTEVRLRQPSETKNVFRHAVREILRNAPTQVSTTLSDSLAHSLQLEQYHPPPAMPFSTAASSQHSPQRYPHQHTQAPLSRSAASVHAENIIHDLNKATIAQAVATRTLPQEEPQQLVEKPGPLGIGRTQIMGNYIIAESDDALVIVDQHAAHERILYEQIKTEFLEKKQLPSQNILSPPILDCASLEVAASLKKYQPLFQRFGFVFEPYSQEKVRVMATPIILKQTSTAIILQDIVSIFEDVDNLSENTMDDYLQSRLFEVLATRACHSAIRGFHPLTLEEIHILLRTIEQTPLSSQCNHGRPAFVTLKRRDLERLFERT